MKTPPLKTVKDRFGDKQKLVSAVKGLATDELWLGRVNDSRGLESVSNSKLLRLHDTLTQVKKDFGSRAKLIESILTLSQRGKDTGFKSSLEKFATPRLVDLQTSAARRAKAAPPKAKAADAPAKKKKARSKKAQAKAKAAAAPVAAKAPAAKAKKK